jgi:purine nucleoside permease
MALGMDPRFDLSKAYWILAGIAGIDPAKGSIGSAAWAKYAVDGDLGYEIDAREIPGDWATGIIPFDRSAPYEPPTPPAHSNAGDQMFPLNAALADWAFGLTRDVALPDDPKLEAARAAYAAFPAALRPPFVLEGDTVTADRFWLGSRFTLWAETWTAYWTQGHGSFATSAEEDTGYLQALTFLAHAHKADFARVLDLRTASDYTLPPAGKSAAELLSAEAHGDYAGFGAAVEAAFRVGSVVVHEIAQHWDRYETQPPKP